MQVPETLKGNDYSKEKREELIINNIKLVEDIVKKRFPDSLYEEDELISIGIVGLIKSIDNFDSSKGIPFTSYLKKYINNELSRFLNKESKRIQFSSLDSSDEFIPLSTIASDYEDKELYKSVRNIVDGLPVIEREIVKLHYGFEENVRVTQTEIAKKLCISKSSVSRMLRRALGKVKVTLKRNDLIDISDGELNNVERTGVNEEDFKDVIALKKLIEDYAKYLGLDTEKILDDFNEFLFDFTSRIPIETIEEAKNQKEVKEVVSPYTSMSTKKTNWKLMVVIGVIMVVIVGGCLFFLNRNNGDTSNDITYMIGGVR